MIRWNLGAGFRGHCRTGSRILGIRRTLGDRLMWWGLSPRTTIRGIRFPGGNSALLHIAPKALRHRWRTVPVGKTSPSRFLSPGGGKNAKTTPSEPDDTLHLSIQSCLIQDAKSNIVHNPPQKYADESIPAAAKCDYWSLRNERPEEEKGKTSQRTAAKRTPAK